MKFEGIKREYVWQMLWGTKSRTNPDDDIKSKEKKTPYLFCAVLVTDPHSTFEKTTMKATKHFHQNNALHVLYLL